jgi:hypothetical protein
VICYNKVKNPSHFNQLLTYNVLAVIAQLVFAYDNIMNPQANWNDHKFVTSTTVQNGRDADSSLKSV